MKYYPPIFKSDNFHCAICGVYSHQLWHECEYVLKGNRIPTFITISQCFCCKDLTYWYKEKMIVPSTSTVELPNSDLPEECKIDYFEARDILNYSPRGSAALLRLCIQKLLKILGQSGENINNDIKELVKAGLPVQIQQSLDICRVVGNNAVHPGEIDLQDTPQIAQTLFSLINYIVNDRITKPKEIETLFQSLPDASKEAIKKRDNSP